MKRLTEIGFQFAGKWVLKDDGIDFELNDFGTKKSVLYAFVVSNKVMYVGKSKRTLQERMNNYKNNDASQTTNVKNSVKIKNCIDKNTDVNIYAFSDPRLLCYGRFFINLPAGLEDSIIEALQPEWNTIK
jgi:hypothetical protein